jgi:hypothetical protein
MELSAVKTYGKCPDCDKVHSGLAWCTYCERFYLWSSGSHTLDNFIRYTQLSAEFFEWINFENFVYIDQLILISNSMGLSPLLHQKFFMIKLRPKHLAFIALAKAHLHKIWQ